MPRFSSSRSLVGIAIALVLVVSGPIGSVRAASYGYNWFCNGNFTVGPNDLVRMVGDANGNSFQLNNGNFYHNDSTLDFWQNTQIGTYNWANFYQNGGSLDVGGWLSIARYGGSGYLEVNGGTVHATAKSFMVVGEQGSGYMAMYGGWVDSQAMALGLNSGSYGQLNLNGGTLRTGGIWQGSGTGDLSFSGGTIWANQNNWNFISGLRSAVIYGGGATINNNGYSIGINQTFSGSGGATFSGNNWTTLRQNNTYSGDTVVNGGVLQFSESGSLYNNGANSGNIIVNNGAWLYFNRDNTFGDAGSSGSTSPVTITVNAGGAVGNNGNFNNIANLVLNGGELRANGGASSAFQAYELNNVTVGGSSASTITANTSANGYNGIELGSQGPSSLHGFTTFNVGVTGDARGDLLVSANLLDVVNGGGGWSSGLIKTGPGTMVLSGFNTYTGTTTIGAGMLEFRNASSLYNASAGSWTANNITVSNGATLALGVGGANSFSSDNVATIIANLSGTAGKGFLGGAFVGFDMADGNLTATNPFSDSVNGSLGLRVFGGNTLTLTGNNSHSGSTIISASSTLQVGNGGSSGTLGAGNVVDNGTLIFNRSGSSLFSNVISGTGGLVQSGSGTTILSGANTYTGSTLISGGTLVLGSGGILYSPGWAGSVVTVTNGGVLQVGAWGDGAVHNGGLQNNFYSSSLVLAGGTLRYSATAADAGTMDRGFTIGTGGATLEAAGGANTWTLMASSRGLGIITANNNDLTLSGSNNGLLDLVFSGTGALTKNGTGTWTLSAANTYTGLTKVSGGTLAVNGSIAGALQVDAGATLKGSGSIAGTTTISGTHSPGNSPGLQSFGSSLSYKSTSTVLLEFTQNSTTGRGVSFDGINVAGDLSFDPGAVISLAFNGAGSSVNWNDQLWNNYIKTTDGWLLYSVGGSITGLNNLTVSGSFLDSNGLALSTARPNSYFNLYQVGNNVYLNYAIPEPSTYALIGLGALALVIAYRRKVA